MEASTSSAFCASSFSSRATAGCSSTNWRLGRTTPVTSPRRVPDQPVRAAASRHLRPAARLARTTSAAAMANLLGDLWKAGNPTGPRHWRFPAVKLHLTARRCHARTEVGHITAWPLRARKRNLGSARGSPHAQQQKTLRMRTKVVFSCGLLRPQRRTSSARDLLGF